MQSKLFKLVGVTLFLLLFVHHLCRKSAIHNIEAATSLRFLSADIAPEGGEEERGEGTAKLPTKLAKWLSENRQPQEVLNLMELPKNTEELFRHSNFDEWLHYVYKFRARNPSVTEYPFSILKKRFTDDKIAAAIESLQLSHEQRYQRLKTDWDKYNKYGDASSITQSLRRRDFINWWVKYTKKFNKENIWDTKVSMISLMRKNLRDRDLLEKVQIIIEKGADKERIIAKKIKEEILSHWLQSKKSPYDTFLELQFSTEADMTPFETPLYSVWIDYLDDFNKMEKESAITNVEVFLHYYTPSKLSEMISSAEASDLHAGTETAQRFKFELLQHWFSDNKLPDQLFNELQNERSGLHLWIEYLSYYTALLGNGEKWLKSVVDTNPYKTFIVLQAAWSKWNLETDASRLLIKKGKGILREKREKDMSPQEVFNLFRLNQIGDELLNNPLFEKWLKYTKTFPEVHHNNGDPSWLVILDKSYDDIQICYMMEKGLQNPDIKNMVHEVEDAFMNLWLDSSRNPHKFLIDLKLNRVLDEPNFLARPTFRIWEKYLNKFDKASALPKMITILKNSLKNKMLFEGLERAMRNPKTKELANKLLKGLNVQKRT